MKSMLLRMMCLVLLLGAPAVFIQTPGGRADAAQTDPLMTLRHWLQTQDSRQSHEQEMTGEGFVIVRAGDGTSCRPMTMAEFEEFHAGEERMGLSAISRPEAQLQQLTQQGFKIVLRSSSQLDNFPEAKDAFLRAAARWESIITTPISVIIDVDFGPTRFGKPYSSSSVIGATSNQTLGATGLLGPVRSALLLNATNSQQSSIFTSLPSNTLPTDLGSTSTVFASSPVLRAMGFLAATADPAQEPNFGPPPSIGFNSAIDFDFDQANGIDADKVDFYAAAVHEIGHVLGFTSFVGLLELNPSSSVAVTQWDLYRFRPGVDSTSFGASKRLLVSGGEHVHFAGLNDLSLSTGRIDGEEGDGQQASHWKDDAQSGSYVGIMDPTASDGIGEEITAQDLITLGHFGYADNNTATVHEKLSVDDGGRNVSLIAPGAMAVNRFSPSRYPAKVVGLTVNIPFVSGQPSPVGASLRVIVFKDPDRTGQPPATQQFLYDQIVTVPNIGFSRFVEFRFDGPTIDSGDVYIGVQATNTVVGIAVDTNGPDNQRSFISTGSGNLTQQSSFTFQPLVSAVSGATHANFMARVELTSPFAGSPMPSLTSVSPNVVQPGGAAFTLIVQGRNFQRSSVVRWNGSDRQTTFVSGGQLRASISAADIASAGNASVTVFSSTPGGGTLAALPVSISATNPGPTLARTDPNAATLGAGPVNIRVFGTNFTQGSVIRLNGADRTTTFVSSVELTGVIPAGDLNLLGSVRLTVFTPGPGGGTSNEVNFSVINCGFSISTSNRSYSSKTASDGVTLNTGNSVCGWTAGSDAAWLKISTPLTGSGKSVIKYTVDPNNTPNVRTGNLTIGGQTLQVRQAGLLTTVSAANFGPSMTAEAIVSGFAGGLATGTLVATTTPLPTNLGGTSVRVTDAAGTQRNAALFFVSANQVNFQIPAGTLTGDATIEIFLNSELIASGTVSVQTVAPSLFSANADGKEVAAALILRVKGDGSQVFEQIADFDQGQNKFVARPVVFGDASEQLFLLMFGTGIRGRSSLGAVNVKIGTVDHAVDFAGPQGDFVGLDQLNIKLSRNLIGAGEVPIILTVDGKTANQLTIRFQ